MVRIAHAIRPYKICVQTTRNGCVQNPTQTCAQKFFEKRTIFLHNVIKFCAQSCTHFIPKPPRAQPIRRMPRCDAPPCLLKTVPSLHPQFDPPSVSRLPPADLWSLPSRLPNDEMRKILFHLVNRQSAADALIL